MKIFLKFLYFLQMLMKFDIRRQNELFMILSFSDTWQMVWVRAFESNFSNRFCDRSYDISRDTRQWVGGALK